MADLTFTERLDPQNGPKRILSLDGGGVRGALTLGILEHLEKKLAAQYHQRTGHPAATFCLSDYFDLIVGTSTGAIIGTMLATGLPVSVIQGLYTEFAETALKFRISAKKAPMSRTTLVDLLAKNLVALAGWEDGRASIRNAPLRTGWGVVVRAADTDHTWFVHNNPKAKFFDEHANQPLVHLVRASAAAYPAFDPERIVINRKVRALVDGGIGAFNNPSFGAFMLATLRGKSDRRRNIARGFAWPRGESNLLLVSVGTGWFRHERTFSGDMIERAKGLTLAPDSVASDTNFLMQTILRWLGTSPQEGFRLHGMTEDLTGESPFDPNGKKGLLSYVRYDAPLHDFRIYPSQLLERRGGLHHQSETAFELGASYHSLTGFIDPKNVEPLGRIGTFAGAKLVKSEHFEEKFIPAFWPRKADQT